MSGLKSARRFRYDPVRQMRRLRRWAASLQFPETPYEGAGYYHWKLAMPQVMVSPPHGRLPVQSACAQVLIDTTERLILSRPRHLGHVRAVTILGFPDMFSSEICLFFDPDYFAGFCDRDLEEQRWSPRPAADLVETLNLSLPAGFGVRGFDEVCRDVSFDPPWTSANQVWLIGEVDG